MFSTILKESVRCFGETKFFRQCPRYIIRNSDKPCFCYEHIDQTQVRLEEVQVQNEMGQRPEWAPLGAFLSNLDTDETPIQPILQKNTSRLQELADDDQNVHTAEVQIGVSNAIKKLKQWAKGVKTERDLALKIEQSLESTEHVEKALEHLRHCYQWNDETCMFGVTYPQLASWVWARVTREHENRELLMERFFEEVEESTGQCLNGNMARLMNVFAAIDVEMSPQQIGMSKEQVQHFISKAVTNASCLEEAYAQVKSILNDGGIPEHEWNSWLKSIDDFF